MPELNLTRIEFPETDLMGRDGHKLRGYVGGKFNEDTLLHNHLADGRLRRHYPLVQYKIAAGKTLILGIDEAGTSLTRVFLGLDSLSIGQRTIPLIEKRIDQKRCAFGWAEAPIRYRFETPWLALNQANYGRWCDADEPQRTALLSRILVGNLLSLARDLNHFLARDQRIRVTHDLRTKSVTFKNQPMIGFVGTFSANFVIPDWLGIGKSCARGFGTVTAQARSKQ